MALRLLYSTARASTASKWCRVSPVLHRSSCGLYGRFGTSVSDTKYTKATPFDAPFEPSTLPPVNVASEDVMSWKGDILAVGVFEGSLDCPNADSEDDQDGTVKLGSGTPMLTTQLDPAVQGIISDVLAEGDFKGAVGSSLSVRIQRPFKTLMLVGLGKADSGADKMQGAFRRFGEAIAAVCKGNKGKTVGIAVDPASNFSSEACQSLSYGLLTGGFESTRFKSKPPKETTSPSFSILTAPTPSSSDSTPSVPAADALARGNLYARWLVDAPANVCTPAYLAASASAIASAFPDVMKCEVLEKEACEEMGMGCYLGVAECSELPPKFIHLVYTPPGNPPENGFLRLALVGKGLTFDTGGYNIKSAASQIHEMKFDMGGAAAVFGAARAIAEIQPAGVEVHFISASCENMIDGKGMRPGDVLKSAAGKTVEVGNTDAEGRLTLCDALWYAQEIVGATKCIDIATLTGAQIIALGKGIGAVMAPEGSGLAEEIIESGKRTGEKHWELPLEEPYFEMMKSKCADFNNVGGREAGSITAGLFLKQFVDDTKMTWAHMDIAGPVWRDGMATGFGATTLTEWVVSQGRLCKQD